MEPRFKQCYEVTLPGNKGTTRRVFINSQGVFLGKKATLDDKNQILREVSTLLATNADYYVERITSKKKGCTVQFLNLGRQPPQYQRKIFDWTELEDNPEATITQRSLPTTVQSAVRSAAKTAVRQSDSIGNVTALKHKERIKKAKEEKARLIEEARINAEKEVLSKQAARAVEEKAKQDAEARVIADRVAGKKFFKFNPSEDKVAEAAKAYEKAKFTDRLTELGIEKRKIFTTYLDTIPLEKTQQFSKKIKKEITAKRAELKKKEHVLKEKLAQHLPKIASAQLAGESAFETAYKHYDQSIASQQRKIFINALNEYKKTSAWGPDAVRTLALALHIDPKGIEIDQAAVHFYNALKNKTREEIANLFDVMQQKLNNKEGRQEKYKDHPFITLFKASYVKEQKKLSEDAVKKDATESLSSLRTAAQEQITHMHQEIEQDLAAYQAAVAEYERFVAKERDDFIATQKWLATAHEQVMTLSDKAMAEFSRFTTSIEDMQKKAHALQAEITAKEQEFKLPTSDQTDMAKFAQLTQSALAVVKEEKVNFSREESQLLPKFGQTDISLEQAQKAISNTQDKQMSSLQKSRQQEEMAKTALQEIQSRHARVIAEAAAEAERMAMREKLYNTLKTLLIDQVDYWKKQQGITGGMDVLGNSGKKTNVPTGIGEMIRAMDERRKPLADNQKKLTISLSRFFKNNTKPIPSLPLEERKVSPEVVMQRLKELKEIASKRLITKDFLGRTKKHAGRTGATKDFYEKLLAISDTDLTDVKKLEKHIQAFDGSLAKQAQAKMSHKPRK